MSKASSTVVSLAIQVAPTLRFIWFFRATQAEGLRQQAGMSIATTV
jgi:hypothetical protein